MSTGLLSWVGTGDLFAGYPRGYVGNATRLARRSVPATVRCPLGEKGVRGRRWLCCTVVVRTPVGAADAICVCLLAVELLAVDDRLCPGLAVVR
jgi:hypothetical protein